MPEQDATEVVVAGFGDIYIAPHGTTLPTAERETLADAFRKLGYIDEDGLSFAWNPSVEDYMAWQSRVAIRRELTGQEFVFNANLEQWNEWSLTTVFGGGEVTEPSPGHYRYDFVQNDEQLADVSAVFDWQDGDKHYRTVVERCNATDNVETQLQRGALAMLPLSLKVLEVVPYILTDDPAFELSS